MHNDIDNDPKVVAARRQAVRRRQIDEAFAGLPKRKSGPVSRLAKQIEALDATLTDYDEQPGVHPFADLTETLYEQTLVRLSELVAEQERKAAEKAASKEQS